MVKRKRFARYKDPSTHSSVRGHWNNSRVESIQIIEYYRSKANNIGGYGRSIGSILVGRETIQLPETGKRTTPRHAFRNRFVRVAFLVRTKPLNKPVPAPIYPSTSRTLSSKHDVIVLHNKQRSHSSLGPVLILRNASLEQPFKDSDTRAESTWIHGRPWPR